MIKSKKTPILSHFFTSTADWLLSAALSARSRAAACSRCSSPADANPARVSSARFPISDTSPRQAKQKQPKTARRAPAARKAIFLKISTYCLLVPFAHVVTLPANVIMVCPLPSRKGMVWVAVMEAALAGFVLRAPMKSLIFQIPCNLTDSQSHAGKYYLLHLYTFPKNLFIYYLSHA